MVIAHQVRRNVACIIIDDCERLHSHLYQLVGYLGHLAHISLQTCLTVEKHKHRLVVGSTLYFIHTLHSLGIGRITAYTPNGIGRVKYHSPLTQHLYTCLYIFFHLQKLLFVSCFCQRLLSAHQWLRKQRWLRFKHSKIQQLFQFTKYFHVSVISNPIYQ